MALINVLFLAALLLICAVLIAPERPGPRIRNCPPPTTPRPPTPAPLCGFRQELPGCLRASRRRARRARMRGGHEG
jgi:hypothetical protein